GQREEEEEGQESTVEEHGQSHRGEGSSEFVNEATDNPGDPPPKIVNGTHDVPTQRSSFDSTEDAPSKLKPQPNFKHRLASRSSAQNASVASFTTAPSEPQANNGDPRRTAKKRPSFVTALEPESVPDKVEESPQTPSEPTSSPIRPEPTNSRTSLIRHKTDDAPQSTGHKQSEETNKDSSRLETTPGHVSSGLVRFDVPSRANQRSDTYASIPKISSRRSWRHLRHGGRPHPGEIVKTEKMLVKVDYADQQLPQEYNENDSIKTETRTLEKWREYVVVCRESQAGQESEFSIQLYKTRVIPAVDQAKTSKRWTYEIPLIRKTTNVNLYSSLDKTLVVWFPWKQGTKIFILRPRSAASSVEWYTFVRNTLGWNRPQTLLIHVPDLSVNISLHNPFKELESTREAARAASSDEGAVQRTMEAERATAGLLIQRSVDLLKESSEWANVLESWLKDEKMGLAWKRYDRLEWVHGANEQQMYGTMAMQKSHDLELRPKKHYATHVKDNDLSVVGEPAPLEGFLIRLTSQKGRDQRLGKMFFKRLYFSTHNQYLCYCRPAKARPPPPPDTSLNSGGKVPTASEITEQIPIIYSVNPYPVKDGKIGWLDNNLASRQKHDEQAYAEAARRFDTILEADGYVNLCDVVRVRNVRRGSTPVDTNIDQGSDVDFHEEVPDTARDDGKTTQFDDNRTFELVLQNRLIIRLQAFNEDTKKEWVTRLRHLIAYWKLRTADDMSLLKSTRQANLKQLDIDEEMEAHLGQFAEKWEVTRAVASSQLFNICGISCCRAITMAGVLYRKPRRHTTFHRCGVILCHGHLLIFHGALRKRTGEAVPFIQHEREDSIPLANCYVYSGLVTEGDLLYQNRTFDANHPGHHALPRVYLEDGWTSTDEDTMTTFVVWQPRRRSFFKEAKEGGGRLRYVSRLGVPGRSIVFKARSRVERDHWVMSIGMEIDRLQGAEEVRVVEK
ncbi:MAG: hypothetical protein Q9190_008024, partial [Brigantiaea leucoxantha]